MSNRSLNDEQIKRIRFLYTEYHLTKTELAKRFNCSITTIALWLPIESKYRDFKLNFNKKHKNICKKCNEPIKTHKKCKYCTILLHDNQCDCYEKYENN